MGNGAAILETLLITRRKGSPIIAAGVGSGLTAKGAAAGGADLLAVYNTAVYRVRGLPTAMAFLPYDDANQLTRQAAPEVLANAGDVPVLLGFGAHDPRVPVENLVQEVKSMGAAGVTNEPFLGLYSEDIQAQLNANGLGFQRELALIRQAVLSGLLALAWTFTPEEAGLMAEAGAQIIGAVVGVTAGGAAGGSLSTARDQAVMTIKNIAASARSVREEIIILGHGGPLNSPEAVDDITNAAGADGYATGSTGERIPVVNGVAEAIQQYKAIRLI